MEKSKIIIDTLEELGSDFEDRDSYYELVRECLVHYNDLEKTEEVMIIGEVVNTVLGSDNNSLSFNDIDTYTEVVNHFSCRHSDKELNKILVRTR